jgi:hypothetical protein
MHADASAIFLHVQKTPVSRTCHFPVLDVADCQSAGHQFFASLTAAAGPLLVICLNFQHLSLRRLRTYCWPPPSLSSLTRVWILAALLEPVAQQYLSNPTILALRAPAVIRHHSLTCMRHHDTNPGLYDRARCATLSLVALGQRVGKGGRCCAWMYFLQSSCCRCRMFQTSISLHNGADLSRYVVTTGQGRCSWMCDYLANRLFSAQLALLTTILKDLDPDPASTLFHLIQQRGWQPRWQDIPLPEGTLLTTPSKLAAGVHNGRTCILAKVGPMMLIVLHRTIPEFLHLDL